MRRFDLYIDGRIELTCLTFGTAARARMEWRRETDRDVRIVRRGTQLTGDTPVKLLG